MLDFILAVPTEGERKGRRNKHLIQLGSFQSHNINYSWTLYSKIPLLRPPKIKTNSPLKSTFKKCQSFFLCDFCTQCLLEGDHLWDCSKVVIKTTFEQSQRWSYYRNFTVVESVILNHLISLCCGFETASIQMLVLLIIYITVCQQRSEMILKAVKRNQNDLFISVKCGKNAIFENKPECVTISPRVFAAREG